jgi:tetratricopeptide (TPR) repeat protein
VAVRNFEQYRYVSGLFEIHYAEGVDALAERSNARPAQEAQGAFAQAAQLAEMSGCCYATVLASLGAMRAALAGNAQDVSHHVDRMRALMCADIALGAAGIGTVAVMQVVGRVDDAIKIAQRCEKFFRERGLDALESQSVFMVGSAHALLGRWGKAKIAWRRGISVDVRRRAPLAAADKQAALAQAMAMEEFSRDSAVSAAVMSQIERLLADAERNAASCGETGESVRARAKILQTHAQLCMIAQRPVDAVRYLGKAREQYALRRLDRDVALSDALLGLALLELAKAKGGRLYEESIAALQRSLEFFASTQHAHIRWKLKYYLAIAGLLNSRTRSEAGYRNQWMMTASAWLEGALEDVSTAKTAGGNAALDGDFSPGLGVQALESLSQALRKGAKTKKPRLLRLAPRGKRAVRQIH